MGYELPAVLLLNNPELQFVNYQPRLYNNVQASGWIVPAGGFVNCTGFSSLRSGYSKASQNPLVRMDSKANGGNGDGKASVDEALKDLNIQALFQGLEENSDEYKNLKKYTDKIPAALAKYAGNDNEFTDEEWDKFLNSEEWSKVIDTHKQSSNYAEIEMGWVDNNQTKDSVVTSVEVKAEIYSKFARTHASEDSSILKIVSELIDKYAGSDNKFTKEEYINMLKDSTYSNFMKKYYDCRPGTRAIA